MAKLSKNQAAAVALVDRQRRYGPADAISLAKQAKFAKFDETLELHRRLGVDPRHADQQVRGPRGLMPSPKAGTVANEDDIGQVVKELKAGRRELRIDKTANLHIPVG